MGLDSFGHEDAASASGAKLKASLKNIVDNRSIRDFLSDTNRCYVIGPKGSGKTLLLLKKALEAIEDRSVLVIPNNFDIPVDRLTGHENLGARFAARVRDPAEASLAWAAVWENAILKATLYNLCDAEGRPKHISKPIRSGKLRGVVQHYDEVARVEFDRYYKEIFGVASQRPKRAVYSFYAEMVHWLDGAGARGIDKVRKENNELRQILSETREPVSIFMDNLDEYHELMPGLWQESMFGQFCVVRDIRLTLRHIHIFTSLRKDIYLRFRTDRIMQFNDFITFLDYTRDELLCVFSRAIERLDAKLFAHPELRKRNPWKAFFSEVERIRNVFVRDCEEPIQDYVLRHSLWRPRDLISIGNRILEVKGDSTISDEIVRRGVDLASSQICQQYLAEVQAVPPLDAMDVQEFVAEWLPSNIFRCEEALKVCQKFNEQRGHVCGGDCRDRTYFHPLCMLHAVGLIGSVQRSVATGGWEQVFVKPGESRPLEGMQKLPKSAWYLVHPILTTLLGHERLHTRQIVGHGLPFDEGNMR